MRKPWFRKQTQQWYVHDGVRQVSLGPDREEAFRVWHAMAAGAQRHGAEVRLLSVAEQFLTNAERTLAPSTLRMYTRYLAKLCQSLGLLRVGDLKRHHVTGAMDAEGWQDPSRWAAITSLKRCLNWAADEGLIDANPLRGLKRPPLGRREHLITPQDHRSLLETADKSLRAGLHKGGFKLLLLALRHSGARPGEVSRVTAADYMAHNQTWVLRKHKTGGKTGKPRVIHLTPCLQTISRILAAARPEGPLFLNSKGQPWRSQAIAARMSKLRKRLGLPAGTVAYSYRHVFTTQALMNGVPVATVAALLGHSGTEMIARHYGHLDQANDFLNRAAQTAVGTGSAPPLPSAETGPASDEQAVERPKKPARRKPR